MDPRNAKQDNAALEAVAPVKDGESAAGQNRPVPHASNVVDDPWDALRQFTAARIAQGRVGVSLPTAPQLAFQLAHARARDAVHAPLETAHLVRALVDAGVAMPASVVQLESAAPDRQTYLQRPDLGRQLSSASRQKLMALQAGGVPAVDRHDIALVVADGLSPIAVLRQAPPLLAALRGAIDAEGWRLTPLTIVRQARVAIGDEIGALLDARMVVVLIGERPGLSAPDSMGLYLTWMPRVGLTDASRNCISNVRDAGLAPVEAARRLHQLLVQAFARQLSGVQLKDLSSVATPAVQQGPQFRLVAPGRRST